MLRKVFPYLLLGILIYSCVPHRNIVYLQDGEPPRDTLERQKFEYRVQPGDVLYISVSSYNSQLTDFFNVTAERNSSTAFFYTGYTIDNNGYIHVPVLDSLHVAGMSVQNIQKKLRDEIGEYVTGPNVIVKLVNFKVTILGEVRRPGLYPVEANEYTILEAIADAGDVMELGDRQNVRLVRKEGSRTRIVNLDLTDRALIASPYFYLQPNDVLYVEPLKQKSKRENISAVARVVGILSGLAIVARLVIQTF
ncbi:polysaccharide biosynthesis/export family protein [Cytophagaceae bacterium ABcell3]|nr:polysaccharide biosynthesis/export family protein [Cytophagaceae bacterium ABcell3]